MFYNTHSHKQSSDLKEVTLYNQYPQELNLGISCFSTGIHPWYINIQDIQKELEIIISVVNHTNCKAVGECGLDNRIEIPFELQKDVFKKQLQIAQQNHKPVIVHCVGCFQEVIAIKKEMNLSIPMVIHGYSKNSQIAKQLLDNGFYLSFGKYLLRNPALTEVFENIPLDRIFLETDMIEENIRQVYEKAASIKNIPIAHLTEIIESNFNKVFNHG